MSEQDEQIRKEFEAACAELGYTGYIEPLFDLYKAGRASFVVELPEDKPDSGLGSDSREQCMIDGYNLALWQARKKVHAAGAMVK